MTALELEERIVTRLARSTGTPLRRWRAVLGPIRMYDRATHPHCNWSFAPSGSAAENAAVERLLDEVRVRYPIVADDR